jgi:Na+/proline symporter
MVARCIRNDRYQLKRSYFISVPGTVGKMTGSEYIYGGFEYYMMVIGFFIGYFIVAAIITALYYKMNLTSIYTYLGKRFNVEAHKIGSIFLSFQEQLGLRQGYIW